MASNQFFATAGPLRLFLKVAIPGMISMLAMSMYLAFEGIKVSFTICGPVSVLCTVAMCFFPRLLASIFVDPGEVVLMELAVHAIPLFGLAFLLGWFGFAVQGFFAAVEKPLPATILSVCRAMVFPVLLIYSLSWMGLDGLWLNYAGTALLAAILAVGMLLKVQKKMRQEMEQL